MLVFYSTLNLKPPLPPQLLIPGLIAIHLHLLHKNFLLLYKQEVDEDIDILITGSVSLATCLRSLSKQRIFLKDLVLLLPRGFENQATEGSLLLFDLRSDILLKSLGVSLSEKVSEMVVLSLRRGYRSRSPRYQNY